MSADATPSESNTTQSETSLSAKEAAEPRKRIYLVSYPKVVFFYPTFLAALVVGILAAVRGNESDHVTQVASLIFLAIFALNLIVISFDFPRTTSLTLFFFVVAVVVFLWAIFRLYPDYLPRVTAVLAALQPFANSTFYFLFAAFLAAMFIGVLASVQFDYWEIRPNELLHHHGILSDLERFSAPNLRIDKEINDVFEYILLRAGRLILHPSNERRAIVLENVFFINRKEAEITQMLGALQVQVRTSND